jgi:hypothetical protein
VAELDLRLFFAGNGIADTWLGAVAMVFSDAQLGFAAAVVITRLERRAAVVVYPIATLVAASRGVVGVHWPTDVLAGAAFGTLSGLLARWLVVCGRDQLARFTGRARPER